FTLGGATDIASAGPPIVDDSHVETTCAEHYALIEHIFDDTPTIFGADSISACAAPAVPPRSVARRARPPPRTAPARCCAAPRRHRVPPRPSYRVRSARGHVSARWLSARTRLDRESTRLH